MKRTRDAKPPPMWPATGRPQPVRTRHEGAAPEAFSRFVGHLARLENLRPRVGKDGEGGR